MDPLWQTLSVFQPRPSDPAFSEVRQPVSASCAGGLIFSKPRKTAPNRIMNNKTELQGN